MKSFESKNVFACSRVRLLTPVLIFLLINHYTFAQEIVVDRNGDDVFLFYEANKSQFTLASGDPALSIGHTFAFDLGNFYYIDYDNDGEYRKGFDSITVYKSWGLSTKFKLKSTDDYLFLSDLANMRPAFDLEIGIQNTIDKVHNINELKNVKFAKAWGVMAKLSMDNTKLYDSVAQTAQTYRPWSIEFKSHITLVRFRWILLSASVSAAYTWNKDDLLKYQKNKPSYVDANAIALDDFVGYIGKAERGWHPRARLSAPLFLPVSNDFLSSLSLAPYGVIDFESKTKLFGLALNYFSEPISGRNYTYAEAFGVGVDWERAPGQPVNAKIFIFGTLNIGKLTGWDKAKDEAGKKKNDAKRKKG